MLYLKLSVIVGFNRIFSQTQSVDCPENSIIDQAALFSHFENFFTLKATKVAVGRVWTKNGPDLLKL